MQYKASGKRNRYGTLKYSRQSINSEYFHTASTYIAGRNQFDQFVRSMSINIGEGGINVESMIFRKIRQDKARYVCMCLNMCGSKP